MFGKTPKLETKKDGGGNRKNKKPNDRTRTPMRGKMFDGRGKQKLKEGVRAAKAREKRARFSDHSSEGKKPGELEGLLPGRRLGG